MKKINVLFVVLFIIGFISVSGAEKKFGKEIKIEEFTKISEILEKPENFLEKTIKIEGNILDVCAHKGCWMNLSSDKEFQKLRIKVKDGDMVFPLSAKGKKAVVEGSLFKVEISKEQCLEIEKNKCKMEKREFDPSKITGGKTLYLFKPTGVAIN